MRGWNEPTVAPVVTTCTVPFGSPLPFNSIAATSNDARSELTARNVPVLSLKANPSEGFDPSRYDTKFVAMRTPNSSYVAAITPGPNAHIIT